MKYILYGCIATLDAAGTVIPDGALYIDGEKIAAVRKRAAPVPPGFDAGARALETHGTIYPGLIELHNHPPYNIMPTWHVDRKYQDRETWRASPVYDKALRSPMKVLQRMPELLPALARFVDSKALVAGVTTTAGIPIGNQSNSRFYIGLIRAVEQTLRSDLPNAFSQVNDVDAASVDKFYEELLKSSAFILHLSEGDDQAARQHFLAMRRSNGDWALTAAFAGIHCVGLNPQDFKILGDFKASMVWSPLSNILLYGKTTDVSAALAARVTIGMGADWSFTGSKSAFGELKCIRAVNRMMEIGLSDREIVSMATINAAKILKWENALGSIEPGKYADVVVVHGSSHDPYHHLVSSREERISLVFIDGEPAFGTQGFMHHLGVQGESLLIGDSARIIAYRAVDLDPAVAAVSLADATSMLRDALHDLPELARQSADSASAAWRLLLPELDDVGVDQRLRLTAATQPRPAGPPLPLLEAIELDALTVADDPAYFDNLTRQINMLPDLADEIKALYI